MQWVDRPTSCEKNQTVIQLFTRRLQNIYITIPNHSLVAAFDAKKRWPFIFNNRPPGPMYLNVWGILPLLVCWWSIPIIILNQEKAGPVNLNLGPWGPCAIILGAKNRHTQALGHALLMCKVWILWLLWFLSYSHAKKLRWRRKERRRLNTKSTISVPCFTGIDKYVIWKWVSL